LQREKNSYGSELQNDGSIQMQHNTMAYKIAQDKNEKPKQCVEWVTAHCRYYTIHIKLYL